MQRILAFAVLVATAASCFANPLVAGDPEDLLLQGKFQGLVDLGQLVLVLLQVDEDMVIL